MITLKIIEKNNIIDFKEQYAPIVCGNSNYTLEFEFGDDWQNVTNKIAVLDLAGVKTAIDFVENTLNLPPIDAPASSKVIELYLMSAETEKSTLITNKMEIKIEPTHSIRNLPEFEKLETHVEKLLNKIDSLVDGSLELSTSKHAKTADVAHNVSNPNLLINGDFQVNQRGQTTYTEAGKYTVDRWRLVSGSVEVKNNGIMLNGTIVQKLEHAPSIQVVASSNAGTISYSNGAVTISTTTATLITYAKLEVGTTATPFSPKTYAEELAMCQRYFQNAYANKNIYVVRNTSEIRSSWEFNMRTSPTLKAVNPLRIFQIGTSTLDITQTEAHCAFLEINSQTINVRLNNFSGLTQGNICLGTSNNIIATLDAEMY